MRGSQMEHNNTENARTCKDNSSRKLINNTVIGNRRRNHTLKDVLSRMIGVVWRPRVRQIVEAIGRPLVFLLVASWSLCPCRCVPRRPLLQHETLYGRSSFTISSKIQRLRGRLGPLPRKMQRRVRGRDKSTASREPWEPLGAVNLSQHSSPR